MTTLIRKATAVPLGRNDRCDRCGAQAVIETALIGGGSLMWCAQDFTRNQAALSADGAKVVFDGRHLTG
jgi:hypothetical protein